MFFPMDRESLTEATSGAIGALVSTIVLYPLDTCKTKLQAELQTHQGMHKYRFWLQLSRLVLLGSMGYLLRSLMLCFHSFAKWNQEKLWTLCYLID